MISKELLSEVLGGRAYEFKIKGNTVYQIYENGLPLMNDIPINIYELAYKCKEWAYNKKDTILTSWKDRDCCYCEVDNNIMCFSADDEAIAIFKACEWISTNNVLC